MKYVAYIANKPKTPQDALRRAIAVVLDNELLYRRTGRHQEFFLLSPDMDTLVDRIAKRVEQLQLAQENTKEKV